MLEAKLTPNTLRNPLLESLSVWPRNVRKDYGKR